MTKQSTITTLLVIPMMASAILLSTPVLADNVVQASQHVVRHKTSVGSNKKHVAGIVSSISGTTLTITAKDGTQYTVDASHATIMKASDDTTVNPAIVNISDIAVGDSIMARGTINDSELTAENVFDGKLPAKNGKHMKFLRTMKDKIKRSK